MKNNTKLNGKDLINIGIYAALTCVIVTAVSMIGFVPVLLPMICILAPIFAGIPLMLFMTKVRKFGMITIMGIIIGAFLLLTGMGYWALIIGIICGLIADFICKKAEYNSPKFAILAHGILSITYVGCMLPMMIDIDSYFATRQGYGEEYITTLTNIVSHGWLLPVLIVGGFIAGLLGAVLGQRILKKHFTKAGIV